MISKKQMIAIPELNLLGKVTAMSDGQFISYVKYLNSFIDRFPSLSAMLLSDLDSKSYEQLSEKLEELSESLDKIGADKLLKECLKQIKTLTISSAADIEHDSVEAFMDDLVQKISTISIEMRMAAHQSLSGMPAQVVGADSPDGAGPSGSGRSILAVDNSVMFLNTLQKFLANAPYDLHTITTCSEAIGYVSGNKPDLFLLDIEMPDMDGYELAHKLRIYAPGVPIIFITAHYADEYVDKAVEAGATAVLMKPLSPKQLLAKLKEVFG